MRFLTPSLHGLLDYASAGALIVLPFLLGLESQGPIALWFSVIAGAGLIFYSLLTDYPYSAVKIVPFKIHLMFDSAAGLAFIAAPFIFGFSGLVQIYYIVMGVAVLIVVAVTNPAPSTA